MKHRKLTMRMLVLAIIIFSAISVAYSQEVREHDIRSRLQAAYDKVDAVEQTGKAVIEIHDPTGKMMKSEAKTYFAFIRGSDVVCELGNVSFDLQGKKRLLYDHEKRRVYALDAQDLRISTEHVHAASSKAQAEDELVAIAAIALEEVESKADAADALASAVAGVTWLPLLEHNGIDVLLPSNAEMHIEGALKVFNARYKYGRTTTTKVDDNILGVTELTVNFGKEELKGLRGVDAVKITWRVEECTTDPAKVKRSLASHRESLMKRAKEMEYRTPKAFAPGEAVVIPTPPEGKGLLGYLDRWIRKMLGRS